MIRKFSAVIIGASAGGFVALSRILSLLPGDYSIPIIVVQHRSRDYRELLEEVLQRKSPIRIKQVNEKESLEKGFVYLAPSDYHLLIEEDFTFSLSDDPPVNYSRPSIDVSFESAAEIFREKLIGIILTGANNDGSKGIRKIKNYGGTTIAQDPKEAQFPMMPRSAVNTGMIDFIFSLNEIGSFLKKQLIHET